MSILRRKFLKQSAFAPLLFVDSDPLLGLVKDGTSRKNVLKERKFTMQLNGGTIGVDADQRQLINLASKYGFETVVASAKYLSTLTDDQLKELADDMQEKKVSFGLGWINMEFRKDEDTFRSGIKELPALASSLQKAGITRSMTYILPFHAELNYLQNFRLHATRLKQVAEILDDYGIRIGLEYVGPKSIWTTDKHPFIHTMAELRELTSAIGQFNVGIHLDTAHWFTSYENIDSILSLTNKEVVGCDLNDAIPGIEPIQNQPGYERRLPATTGVIDTKAFLEALVSIGFDGPIQAEPFNRELSGLDNETAVKLTAEAMKNAFSLID